MEQLVAFLSSYEGKLVSGALLGVGVLDLLLANIVFGKAIKNLEQTISPTMSPEKRQPIEKQIINMQKIIRFITFMGFSFAAFGIFGLTM